LANVEEAYAVGFGRAAGQKHPALTSGQSGRGDGLFARTTWGFRSHNDDTHQYGGSHLITGDPRVYGRVYVGPPGRGIVFGEPK
jgi:hypothetical protein